MYQPCLFVGIITSIVEIRKLNFRKCKSCVQGTTTSNSRIGFGTSFLVILTTLSICPALHYLLSVLTSTQEGRVVVLALLLGNSLVLGKGHCLFDKSGKGGGWLTYTSRR